MPTLSGLQMKTWTDSLTLKLLSNFFGLYSKRFKLYNHAFRLSGFWKQFVTVVVVVAVGTAAQRVGLVWHGWAGQRVLERLGGWTQVIGRTRKQTGNWPTRFNDQLITRATQTRKTYRYVLRATPGTAIARLSHRNSVRLSVCHTGGSGKNGAS